MRRSLRSSHLRYCAAALVAGTLAGALACADGPISPDETLLRVETPGEGHIVASDVVVRTEYIDATTGLAQVLERSGRLQGRVTDGELSLSGKLGLGDDAQPMSISVLRSGPSGSAAHEGMDQQGVSWLLEREVDESGTRVTVRAFREGELSSVLRYRYSRGDGGRLVSARAEYFSAGSRTQAVDIVIGGLHRDTRAEEVAAVVSLVRRLGGWTADAVLPREAHASTATLGCFSLALEALGKAAAAGVACGGAVAATVSTVGVGGAAGAWACGLATLSAANAYLAWEKECAAQQ